MYAIWIMRIALALLLYIMIDDTFAHHKARHREVYVGEYAETATQVWACLEKTDMEVVYAVGKRSKKALLSAFKERAMSGTCGLIEARVRVVEVYAAQAVDGTPITLTRITMIRNGKESGEVFATLADIRVVEQTAKCVDCIPS